MKHLLVTIAIASSLAAVAETKHWRGTVSELASADANWSPEGAPTAADDIVLDADSADRPLTWDLDTGVASWTQSDYAGTVTFQTGKSGTVTASYTCHGVLEDGVSGLVVSGDVRILSGTWTHEATPAMTSTGVTRDLYKNGYGIYRLVVRVGGNLSLGENAMMDASSKGFPTTYSNYGPGTISELNTVACHGGMGAGSNAAASLSNTNSCYGSVVRPITLGTARSNAGGGSIDLTVVGAFTLNGKLLAETADHNNYPGAGGSVYVKCGSLVMGEEAVISANSGKTLVAGSPGGGGRVAVVVESGTVSEADVAKITANAGRTGHVRSTAGTVFVQDASGAQLIVRGATTSGSGVTPVRNPSELPTTLKRIVLAGAAYLFVDRGLDHTVGEIVATGVSGGTVPRLRTSGGALVLPETLSGFTYINSAEPLTLTASPAADNTLTVAAGATLTLNTPTTLNGSLVLNGSLGHSQNTDNPLLVTNRLDLTVTGDMTIAGAVDVLFGGYRNTAGPGYADSVEYGGTYGGVVTGSGKTVYGSILHPTELGSEGTAGGAAGAVKLTVAGLLTIPSGGAIQAHGNYNNGGSNGSGGSVWLTVGEIAGRGIIDVRGGTYAGATARAGAGGSGGRVAVRQTKGNVTYAECGVAIHTEGGQTTGGRTSGAGTLYWETAADGLDRGVVTIGSNQLPPDGLPAGELTNATIRVSNTATLSLIDDVAVGQFDLPKGATLNLAGHTLNVVNPTASYRKSILGTVDDSQGGTIEWAHKGLLLMFR